jgi:hypothetical protein
VWNFDQKPVMFNWNLLEFKNAAIKLIFVLRWSTIIGLIPSHFNRDRGPVGDFNPRAATHAGHI